MFAAQQLSPSIIEDFDYDNSIDDDNNNKKKNNNNNVNFSYNAQNNGSRRSSISTAPLPPLVNKEACSYVCDYFIVSSNVDNPIGGY